eukprot:TRINITY_DN369_c0_g1_i2.p1 TRINITY_DN369_c0_g1~~TRINITY_DN369_c0_g1_i2.p1  ORF type:complete len:351 (-),score=102.17 TRINITY_DN369_c0_g1_i2:729-1781(-)
MLATGTQGQDQFQQLGYNQPQINVIGDQHGADNLQYQYNPTQQLQGQDAQGYQFLAQQYQDQGQQNYLGQNQDFQQQQQQQQQQPQLQAAPKINPLEEFQRLNPGFILGPQGFSLSGGLQAPQPSSLQSAQTQTQIAGNANSQGQNIYTPIQFDAQAQQALQAQVQQAQTVITQYGANFGPAQLQSYRLPNQQTAFNQSSIVSQSLLNQATVNQPVALNQTSNLLNRAGGVQIQGGNLGQPLLSSPTRGLGLQAGLNTGFGVQGALPSQFGQVAGLYNSRIPRTNTLSFGPLGGQAAVGGSIVPNVGRPLISSPARPGARFSPVGLGPQIPGFGQIGGFGAQRGGFGRPF